MKKSFFAFVMFCFSSSFLTLQNLPDLICTLKIIDIAPDRVNYAYTIKNIGLGNANLDGPTNAQSDNLSIQGYFSKDEVYDASDIPAGGTIIGTSPLGLLKPQTIRTSSTAASKPNPSFYPQTKDMNLKTLIKAYPFIIVKIDNGNNVPEINESNNYATVRIELPTLVTTVAPDIQYNDKIIVQFDKKVYKMTDLVGIKCLLPPNIITSKDESFVLVTSLESKDVEKFDLKLVSPTTASSLQYEIVQKIHLSTKSSKPHDGTFTVKNGESIYVFFVPNKKENTKALITADYLFDVSLIESTAPVENAVIKKLALSKDELQPMSDGKINGTLLTEKGLPIQVAANELIIYPLNQEQLSRFLEKTKGNVISKYDFSSAGPNDVIKSSYLVRVSLKDIEEKNLSQLRKAMGLNDKIYGSNPEVLKLTTLAVQSLLEGYFVGLNIRLLNMSDDTYNYRAKEDTEPRETSQLGSDHIGANFTHPNFNIPAVWAYMALWDKDIKSIPMAFLDQGYTSPQPDYPHINECSIGIINDCGVGKAVGKPTIGASLFGAFVWHGTGTVTVAAGKINNNFGGAGTGAQVVYPHLYKLGGVSDYAFQIGAGIKTAVDNGASIINFSGGYPCAIQTNILGWGMGICNPADRLASCLLIAESAHIAADITCAASAGIPIVGGIICGTAQFVAWTATSTCAPLIGLRDLKVEMEDGVNYALNRGITVVASAGNRISDLPAGIKEIIENKKMTVENWQIIPAIIPGVICVGAANITQNEEFSGDRIDIWAPVHSPYYAPPVGGEMGDISKYIYDDFDASSCSAPYISGLIANVQSINPNLNPLNPNLTNEQRKKIPNTINNLLRSTAYTKASWPTIPSFSGWIDTDNEVTRLVNPIRFIKSASQGIIPDFTSKGYVDINELVKNRESQDNANNIIQANKLDNNKNNLKKGAIIFIPGLNGASPIQYIDYYSLKTPGETGVYNLSIDLTYPKIGDELRLNDDKKYNVSNTNETTDERIKNYRIDKAFNDVTFKFKVSGVAQGDNLYKLASKKVIKDNSFQADIYDRPGGNNNPSAPNSNNSKNSATFVGINDLNWVKSSPGNGTLQAEYAINIKNLNFHTKSDNDFFEIKNFSSIINTNVTGNKYSDLALNISADQDVEITLYDTEGNAYGNNLLIKELEGKTIKFIKITPYQREFAVIYDLNFSLNYVPNLEALSNLPQTKPDFCPSCPVLKNPKEMISNPADYVMGWKGGAFVMRITPIEADAFKVSIVDSRNKTVLTSSYINNGTLGDIELKTANLSPGFYKVVIQSKVGAFKRLQVNLPKNSLFQH